MNYFYDAFKDFQKSGVPKKACAYNRIPKHPPDNWSYYHCLKSKRVIQSNLIEFGCYDVAHLPDDSKKLFGKANWFISIRIPLLKMLYFIPFDENLIPNSSQCISKSYLYPNNED
jgi:hypothetical protein